MVSTNQGTFTSRTVVLATGGLSLPKTGSDGWGYDAAVALGHTIVPTTPALAPLVLERGDSPHASLSGVSIPARLDVIANDAVAARIEGALLWTHFGLSGPAALDASRHFLRSRLDGADTGVTLSLLPEHTFDSLEAAWVALVRARPRAFIQTIVASMMPAAIAEALLRRAGIAEGTTLAALTRDARRALVHATVAWPLPVVDSRGYNYAEVTAGGVDLAEIDPSTMASRLCEGLYLVGEVLDVDGRLGGFNFQWAWSSAHVAGTAIGGHCLIAHRRALPEWIEDHCRLPESLADCRLPDRSANQSITNRAIRQCAVDSAILQSLPAPSNVLGDVSQARHESAAGRHPTARCAAAREAAAH